MYIKSKIIPIQNTDKFIIVHGISNQFNSGPFDLHDTTHVSIIKHQLNSELSLDLTSACTLPFESSKEIIAHNKKMAKGQYKQTKIKDLPLSEYNRYKKNYHEFLAVAKLAELDRLHLPVSIELCGEHHILVGFVQKKDDFTRPFDSKFEGTLRLINIDTSKVSKEKCVKSTGYAVKPRHHAEFVSCSYNGEFALFNFIKQKYIGNDMGQLSIIEKNLFSSFAIKRPQNELFGGFRCDIVPNKTAWVAFKIEMDGCVLKVVEYTSGKVLNQIPLAKNSESFDLSVDTNIAVIGHSNGMLSIVDIVTSKINKFRAHVGVNKDNWMKVKISQDGQWVASSIDNKLLSITNIKNKKTNQLAAMKMLIHKVPEFKSVNMDTNVEPVFSFVNNSLVIVDSNGIQEINPEELLFNEQSIKEEVIDLSNVNFKSSLKEMLNQAGLTKQIETIQKYHSPAIELSTKLIKAKTFRKELGKTQFGGWPDLPKDSKWPMWQNRPMSFLAQINLAEMQRINPNIILPKVGLLSFFLGCENTTYDGNDGEKYMVDLMVATNPKDIGGWRVIYTKEISTLTELRYSKSPMPEKYNACSVEANIGGNQLPDVYSTVYQQLKLKGNEIDNYNKLLEKINIDKNNDELWDSLLMGYSQILQMNPPEIFCERAKQGLYPYQQETKKQLNDSSKWAMIIQLTSDSNVDYIWGDGGYFYFYGNREKIVKGDFSETWVYFEN